MIIFKIDCSFIGLDCSEKDRIKTVVSHRNIMKQGFETFRKIEPTKYVALRMNSNSKFMILFNELTIK